jgi:filamentous hemagglutinin
MALTIVQHPEASVREKAMAAGYIAIEGTAHAALVVGGTILAWEGGVAVASSVAGTEAAATAGTAATAACADTECANEVNAIAQTARNVWELNPLRRGVEIENMLGRSSHLSQNFPVIDRFRNGVATSIKSMDLGAASYQNISTLTSKVTGYVNTLANWQGTRWGGFVVEASDIVAREVLLAVPPGATEAQMTALQQLQQWATTVGVTLNITVVP